MADKRLFEKYKPSDFSVVNLGMKRFTGTE